MVFTVKKDGQATDIVIASTNASARLARTLKQALVDIRFRPRMSEGTAVETPNFKMRQVFDNSEYQ